MKVPKSDMEKAIDEMKEAFRPYEKWLVDRIIEPFDNWLNKTYKKIKGVKK